VLLLPSRRRAKVVECREQHTKSENPNPVLGRHQVSFVVPFFFLFDVDPTFPPFPTSYINKHTCFLNRFHQPGKEKLFGILFFWSNLLSLPLYLLLLLLYCYYPHSERSVRYLIFWNLYFTSIGICCGILESLDSECKTLRISRVLIHRSFCTRDVDTEDKFYGLFHLL